MPTELAANLAQNGMDGRILLSLDRFSGTLLLELDTYRTTYVPISGSQEIRNFKHILSM